MEQQQKQLKLSTIEKQLLIREIKRQGKEPLLEEINKKREIQHVYDEKQNKFGIRRPTCLIISATFYKSKVDKKPLTKKIFDTIEVREKTHNNYFDFNYQTPSNKLGNRTKYDWIEENNTVKIIARFKYIGHDQRALTAFVENYSQ